MDSPVASSIVDHSTRQYHAFAPEVNGLWLGFIETLDRQPWDHDISTAGMSMWLRYMGTVSAPIMPSVVKR